MTNNIGQVTKYFDQSGQEQDAAWVLERYGPAFTQGHSDKYRVAELREAEGNALTVKAKPGTEVRCFFFGYRNGMNSGHTRADGTYIFPLPLNYTYKLAGQGTHWLNVDGLRLIGLGVPEGTGASNWRHLNVVLEKNTLIGEE